MTKGLLSVVLITATAALNTPASLNLFTRPVPWNKAVDTLPKASASDAIINALTASGGWGAGNQFKINFDIAVLTTDANTPYRQWNTTGDWYAGHCDKRNMPVPAGGNIEGESGYVCTKKGDCHLIVLDTTRQVLYEMWKANVTSSTKFNGGCQTVWDLNYQYTNTGRGKDCTSADAGGFPIASMLFSADEVYNGAINHAIRFILPNARIRRLVYTTPGTHSTGATQGGSNAPPYGVRFRLKSTFNLSQLSSGARVIARALQKYGMLLADAGEIALTAASDRYTTRKWANLGIDDFSLSAIQVSDFEVVDMGPLTTFQDQCVRDPNVPVPT